MKVTVNKTLKLGGGEVRVSVKLYSRKLKWTVKNFSGHNRAFGCVEREQTFPAREESRIDIEDFIRNSKKELVSYFVDFKNEVSKMEGFVSSI